MILYNNILYYYQIIIYNYDIIISRTCFITFLWTLYDFVVPLAAVQNKKQFYCICLVLDC